MDTQPICHGQYVRDADAEAMELFLQKIREIEKLQRRRTQPLTVV